MSEVTRRAWKARFRDCSPDVVFATWIDVTNLYRWIRPRAGGTVMILPNGSGAWKVRTSTATLLSPTAKFLGANLQHFDQTFERVLKIDAGDSAVDVGACLGDTTIPMLRKVGPKGRVIAVEPEPTNARFLRLNTAHYRNAFIVEKAAWDSKTDLLLHLHVSPAGHSLVDSFPYGSALVRADTLDNILAPFGKIDFLKLDVQGAELQALHGAEETLAKVPKVVVETHYFGAKMTAPKVEAHLQDKGFTVARTPDRVVHAWR